METKAHHVLVGTLAVLLLAALAGFAIWLAKSEIDREFAFYDIFFEGGVSGLNQAATVRLSGIAVGSVREIAFVPDRPEVIRVRIRVTADAPIRADSEATAQLQGVTGLSFVAITGGTAEAPLLTREPGGPVPEITAGRSTVDRVMATAPLLLERATDLVERLNLLFDDTNREAFSGALANLRGLTDKLASSTGQFEAAISGANEATSEIATVARQVSGIADGLANLTNNLDALAVTTNSTMGTADKALRNVEIMLKGDGARLLAETRGLISSLDRLAQRIERNPARFFFGRSSEGYRAQ